MKNIALQLHSVLASMGNRPVLHEIDLSVAAGRWTSIVGPNGAGKSTLLRAMAGLQPCQGQLDLLGRPLADWPARERARTVAWIGQGEAASNDLSVYDAVMLGRLPHQRWLAAPSRADHAAVEQAMRATRCADLRARPLGELSGGERQRVLLARAFAVQAQVLLMDEPLAHLDPPHQADWLALVRSLVLQGTTVVSVLHELTMALQADDVVVMTVGRVVHHGAGADPATHRAMEAVFEQKIAVVPASGLWVALPKP